MRETQEEKKKVPISPKCSFDLECQTDFSLTSGLNLDVRKKDTFLLQDKNDFNKIEEHVLYSESTDLDNSPAVIWSFK